MKSGLSYFSQIALFVFALLCVIQLPAKASDKLAIPIYFVTDRVLDTSSNSELNYSDLQLAERSLNYGIKNIVLVGKNIDSDVTERASGLGYWSPIDASSTAAVANKTLSESEFFDKLTETVNSDSKRPLILFLHGCCQPYKASMETAARLEKAFESPVLLYSWCSIAPTDKLYRENEIRQRNGAGVFYDFLNKLESRVPPEKIVIIAHSMGNRFVHEALKTRFWNRGSNKECPRFRDVIFACADVNVDDFASDERDVAFSCNKLIITKNDTDPALTLSQIQRGFYGRLGAPGWALKKLLSNGTGEIIDITGFYRNSHDLPIPILVDLVRGEEGGYIQTNRFFQKKAHLVEVRR